MWKIEIGIFQENAVILTFPLAPWVPIKSKRDEKGKINVEALGPGQSFLERDICREMQSEFVTNYWVRFWKIYVLAVIVGAILSGFTETLFYTASVCFFLCDAQDSKISGYIFLIKKYAKKENIAYWRMNAAMHKVLNAYNYFGRIPTLEEAKKNSMFCENSRIANMGERFLCFMIFAAFLSVTPTYESDSILKGMCIGGVIVGLEAILAVILNKFLSKYAEIFFLRKPNDEDLEVVIGAVEKIEEIRQDPQGFNEKYMEQYKDFKVWID